MIFGGVDYIVFEDINIFLPGKQKSSLLIKCPKTGSFSGLFKIVYLTIIITFVRTKTKRTDMRKLLAAAAILLFCSTVIAQNAKPKTKLGFKAGLNVSGFRTAVDYPDVKTKVIPGIVLGAYVHIPLSSRFSLQPEFLYSQLGARSQSISQWGGYYTFRYNYFSIPLLVKYNVS